MQATFRSKVDRNLIALGFAAPCVALLAIGTTVRHGGIPLLAASVTALVAVLVAWIVLSTYYELTRELLIAHSGPFRWRIPLREIVTVRASDSRRSGPALSMDRLEVSFGRGRVLLISPQDKPGFLAALQARAPQLLN